MLTKRPVFCASVTTGSTSLKRKRWSRCVNDRGKGTLTAGSSKGAWGNQSVVTVAGGQFRKADGERAMGIDWMTKDALAEATPPVMTEYIGRQLLQVLRS